MDTNRSIHDFDDFALDMVSIKAAELVGKADFTADDFEDIKQDMLLDLLERLAKYDPGKSNFKLFVTCVIDRKGKNLIRYRESEKRDYRREDCSLNEDVMVADSDEPVQRLATIDQDDHDIRTGKYGRPAAERIQLRLDIEAVVAGMPPELRKAAELLQTQTVTQVARALGVPRTTFYDKHLRLLREAFSAKGLNFYVA